METKVDQQPSSMVYVQASELFPKKILSSDESLQVPFPELYGESVECQEKVPDGDLTLSNFRLFIRSKDSFVNIPLRLIESVEIRDIFIVHINCKDARSFRISFDSNEQCTEWYHHLIKCITPVSRLEDLFAFAFHAWCLDSKPANPSEEGELSDFYQTSELPYSFMSEVRRMGFDNLHHAWRITDINSNFQLCSTYPKLHIVPAKITDKEMEAVVKFRTSGRFPSVVWRHLTNGAVIARCSQPEVGWFGWRSPEDEALLQAIGTACTMDSNALSLKKQYLRQIGEKLSSKNGHLKGVPNGDVSVENVDDCDHTNERNEDQGLLRDSSSEGRKVLIVDARAYTAAVVNRAKGGGCEYEEYYPSCEVLFMNLANIHTIRKSFQSLRTLCSGPRDIPNWWSSIEKTNWLHHISLLLKAANTVVNAVDKEQRPVVIHCSDGWDRTSQIVALAELMLDPYYRTIKGFQVLVTREWLEFGHRFADRCGHGHDCDENQRCPVFLQWLDCVHQLTRQFPCSFEFNDTFLVKLAQHTFACLFGTFLCNSESERLRANVLKRTCSVWSLLKPKRREFRNFLFPSTTEQVLHPSCQTRCLQLWSAVYLAYATPYSEAVIESSSTSDYGGSVSSPCNTPTSTLFESNIKELTSNAVDSVTGFRQQCCSSASKSDGDIVICSDCQSSLLERNQHPVNLDGDLKSKSCTECSTSSSHNNVLVKPDFARDHVQNKSLYLSAEGVCAGSILPCEDSIGEVESSMSSSTATVILEQSEEDSSLANKKSSSVKKLINENSLEEIQENLCNQKEKNHIILPNGMENAKEDLRIGNSSRHLFFYKEQTGCNTESAQDQVNNSSSDSTLTCDEQEVSPSETTLKASSSHFFTRYLDLDGLTSVVDPVQKRLWQIEMVHQARLESLQRQLALAQRRQDVTGNMDPSGKGCDLADEVCSLPESSVSGDQPSLSLSSADEGSWIQVEENDTKVTLWVPDHAATNCAKCDAQFWVANRKHHCRNCGLVFCGSCSENRLPVPDEQLYDPVRVCYSCFEKLVTLQGRENGGWQNSEAAGS